MATGLVATVDAPGAPVDPRSPAVPVSPPVEAVPARLAVPASSADPAVLAALDQGTRLLLDAVGQAGRWDAPARQELLVWLARHRDVLAVIEGRVLTTEREAGTWSLRGDRDLAGFVGRTSRGGRGVGLAAVGQAGTLAAMPAVAEALVDGPVTSAHVAQIARATAQSAVLAAELASPEGQAQVVELAGRLDGAQFGRALAQLSASVDPAGRQRLHDEQRAARSFAWTHTASGTLLAGRVDSVAGHRLAKVIDALCPRPAVDDERTREQRQADALMVLVESAASDPSTTPGALAPVQGIVTFTQETWAALRNARGSDRSAPPQRAAGRGVGAARAAGRAGTAGGVPATVPRAATEGTGGEGGAPVPGSAADVIERLRGVDPVTDERGRAWPASEIARALCDCALTWAMVSSPGAELNLGRQSRVFRRQHWLALYAAGITGCSIDGCGMPLAYCELHHLAWWTRDGGRTDMGNCAPYCSFHHHEMHRLGIVAVRRSDGTLAHGHPDGRPYGGAIRCPATRAQPPETIGTDVRPEAVGRTPIVPDGGTSPPGGPPASADGRDRQRAGGLSEPAGRCDGQRPGGPSEPAGRCGGERSPDLLDLLTG